MNRSSPDAVRALVAREGKTMALPPELSNAIAARLSRFGNDLNLSQTQRKELQGFITEASEKLREYRRQYPYASRPQLFKKVLYSRALLRRRLVNFFTPEQLMKWDAEVAEATEVLWTVGHVALGPQPDSVQPAKQPAGGIF